jgi:hypothetical protein
MGILLVPSLTQSIFSGSSGESTIMSHVNVTRLFWR